jgi:D-psicose/D-tagatose/L-ribulose 3-epimerase
MKLEIGLNMKKIKYSVSNLAWTLNEESEVIKILKDSKLGGIEISLAKYFPNIENVDSDQIEILKNRWADEKFEITSLQSLLYNKPEFNIFSRNKSRIDLINYLNHTYRIALFLGVRPLVFGSPKNRLKGFLGSNDAFNIANQFFCDLISDWDPEGPFIGLEANPPLYGCDFIINNLEAIALVKSIKSPNFKWHLDYGCTLLMGENPIDLIKNNDFLPSHVHLSERNLAPLSKSNFKNYLEFLIELSKKDYCGIVTFEMLPHNNLDSFRESISLVNSLIEEVG